MKRLIKRGDVFYADLSPAIGSEQGGTRPFLILQNNTGNRYSSTVIGAPITSKCKKPMLPTHIAIICSDLENNSIILLEQIRTIDKNRLGQYIGHVSAENLKAMDKAIQVSLGIRM